MKKILSALVFLCLFSVAHAADPYTEELYGLYCKSCHGVRLWRTASLPAKTGTLLPETGHGYSGQ